MARLNGNVPGVRRLVYCEPASMDLPVYPNGYAYPTDCTCGIREIGRTKIDGRWVKVCMQCGSLYEGTVV